MLRSYLPRVCTHLAGLRQIPSLITTVEMLGVGMWLAGLAAPPVQEALSRLGQAIEHMGKGMALSMRTSAELVTRYGCPTMMGGVAKAPFDVVADTLRGTRSALMDLYRRPDKLLAASDALVPTSIHMGVGSGQPGPPPFVFMPLHKGAVGFMSFKQFEKFYWPSFKARAGRRHRRGMVPRALRRRQPDEARLELIAGSGLPAGRTAWLFDRSDLTLVKKHFSGFACFGGTCRRRCSGRHARGDGEHCKRLLDEIAPSGGLSLLAAPPWTKPIRMSCAPSWAARKCGVY
jgi:hypothetical protein